MAYTVDDAVAAAANRQATLPADQVAYIEASVSITDAGAGTITGKGPLGRGDGTVALLGNMWSVWDSQFKFLMQRGGTGPRFLLALSIEPIYSIALGPVGVQLPAAASSLLHQHPYFVKKKRYRGDFALYLQPHFYVELTEQPDPKLTGTMTPLTLTPGAIVPPGSIEVVLESVAVADVFQ